MNFKDLFSKQANAYARYRPAYPEDLFRYLASLTSEHARAWDCGTGSGQAALRLAPHYDQVIATDPSENQIAQARPHPKISYRVASAELREAWRPAGSIKAVQWPLSIRVGHIQKG